MKKNIAFLLMCVLLLPSCKKKANPSSEIEGTVFIKEEKETPKKGKKGLFLDDEVDQFVLEEENNTFSINALDNALDNSVQLTLIDSPQAIEWEARKAAQAKAGIKPIYFDFDEYGVQPNQKETLKHDGHIIKKLVADGYHIVIEGHACSSAGSENYNLHLSEKRAKSVKKMLNESFGIPLETMSTVGRGSEQRIVAEGDKNQQAPNRRVEVYLNA